MKRLLFVAAVIAAVGLCNTAQADFIVNGSGTWNTLTGVTPGSVGGQANEGSGYFWAGNSQDSDQSATVANFLTGTGAWAGGGTLWGGMPGLNLSDIQSYANGTSGVGMTYGTGTITNNFNIYIEVAGLANENQLWFRQGDILTKLFEGNNDNASGIFEINGEFELYLIRGISSSVDSLDLTLAPDAALLAAATWARSAGGSSNNGTDKHFASFRQSTNTNIIYTGIEDIIPLSGSDNDYNDLVISMELLDDPGVTEVVPAPPALIMALFGVASFGLTGLRFRRNRKLALA